MDRSPAKSVLTNEFIVDQLIKEVEDNGHELLMTLCVFDKELKILEPIDKHVFDIYKFTVNFLDKLKEVMEMSFYLRYSFIGNCFKGLCDTAIKFVNINK